MIAICVLIRFFFVHTCFECECVCVYAHGINAVSWSVLIASQTELIQYICFTTHSNSDIKFCNSPLHADIKKYPHSVISRLKSKCTTGRVWPLQVSGIWRRLDIALFFTLLYNISLLIEWLIDWLIVVLLPLFLSLNSCLFLWFSVFCLVFLLFSSFY